jgi:hypothetical protein
MVNVISSVCDVCGKVAVTHLQFSYDKHMDISGNGWDYDWFYADLCEKHRIPETNVSKMELWERKKIKEKIEKMKVDV